MNLFEKKARVAKGFARGFTMIEIMVVVTLVAILVGLSTVYVMGQLDKGKIDSTRAQAYEIAKALDLYKLQTGRYPTVAEGLDVLTSPPRGQPLMKKIPQDPWGNPFQYAIPGTKNPNGFDVWSDGPNGEGGEEAIGNWQEE